MRLWRRQSVFPARMQCVLLAALYVFLSTGGAYLHTHRLVGSGGAEPAAATVNTVRLHTAADADSLPGCTNTCVYCEWQSHQLSVGTSTPVALSADWQSFTYPVVSLTHRTLSAAHAAARAPPVA